MSSFIPRFFVVGKTVKNKSDASTSMLDDQAKGLLCDTIFLVLLVANSALPYSKVFGNKLMAKT